MGFSPVWAVVRGVNKCGEFEQMAQRTATKDIWDIVKKEFKTIFPQDVFETWFDGLVRVEEGEDTLILGTPNEFAAFWIQDNYLDVISQKVCKAAGRPLEIVLEVTGDKGSGDGRTGQSRLENARSTGKAKGRRAPARSKKENKHTVPVLNPRNTFENFIVGSSNQLAHAASRAVANAPARAYNPLFLYGETGLGKTHLMHAIAHYTLDKNPDAKVVYVSCEKFTNEFIRAIQENTLVKFRKFYRNIDILLIDDIQFLAGKERIQEEFFHTFNDLFESQRQICLSSDRPASEISKLESRLVSRFQWGMVTDIQAPDLETRQAILTKKALAQNFDIPDDILQFLAQRITRNVRRMEGALVSVASYAKLMKQPVDVETVERLLQHILQEEAQNQITIEKIQKKVVEFYHLRPSDMMSKRRPSNIAFPRQVAMYLSRILTNHSLQEIGESFGGRDHGTVIHACKTVENMMEQDESVKRNVEYLTKQLSQHNA